MKTRKNFYSNLGAMLLAIALLLMTGAENNPAQAIYALVFAIASCKCFKIADYLRNKKHSKQNQQSKRYRAAA